MDKRDSMRSELRRASVPYCGLALVTAMSGATGLHAQDTIAADRPGLDFSTGTVAPGMVQFEVSLPAVSFDGAGGTDTWGVGFPTLVRVGIAEDVELRAQVSPFNSVSTDVVAMSDSETGVGDLELGAKVRVRESTEGPSIAVIPSITLPTGSAGFTTDGVGYFLNTAASVPLGESSALAFVGGVFHTKSSDDEYDTSGLLALVASRSLADRLGGFVEVGVFPSPGPSDPVVAGGGVALLLSDNVQIDVSVDHGLSDGAPDWQFGSGLAFRLR